jgi:hypothetical protein
LIAGLLGADRPALVPGDGLVRVVVDRRGLGGVDGGIVVGRSGVWRRIPVDMVVGRHEGAGAVLGGSRLRVVVRGGAVQGRGDGGEVRVERRAHSGLTRAGTRRVGAAAGEDSSWEGRSGPRERREEGGDGDMDDNGEEEHGSQREENRRAVSGRRRDGEVDALGRRGQGIIE